jgi:hypothetical protein
MTLYVSKVVSAHFSLNPEIKTTGSLQAQANQLNPDPRPMKNSQDDKSSITSCRLPPLKIVTPLG